MTLDEAIKRAEKVAEDEERNAGWFYDKERSCYKKKGKCAEEHRQLVEWLKNYKRLLTQGPCEDAISRQAVKRILEDRFMELQKRHDDKRYETNYCLNTILDLPPVNPQPKTGHWVEHPEIETSTPEYLMFYECSECGDRQCFCKSDIHKKRFCSNCGCRMDEPQERSDKE